MKFDWGKMVPYTGNSTVRTFPTKSGSNQQSKYLWLADTEFLTCKEKGLRFHSDEKFTREHKSKKQLNILQVHNDDDSTLPEVIEANWTLVGCESVEDGTLVMVHVSFNSISGFTGKSTMKLQGQLHSKDSHFNRSWCHP